MKKTTQKHWLFLLRLMPIVISVLFISVYIAAKDNFSIQGILNYTPKNPVWAAIFILFFYAVECISVIFPIVILQIVTGCIFSPLPAILINLAGMIISLIIPYWMGGFSGNITVSKLEQKHPKIAVFAEKQKSHVFLISFLLRVISILPADLVSIYFGSFKAAFLPYLSGSLLGMLPGMLAVTLMGASAANPRSPVFIISVIITIILSLFSLAVYRIIQQKNI